MLTDDQRIEMYRRMVRIRHFEERCLKLVKRGDFIGACHPSIGQEGEVVGACMAVRDDDYMTGNHRSHGHPIGKGARLDPLMAELFGKQTGVCKGKGGSMHLADFTIGSLGESGVVGGSIPIATGAGLSIKVRGTDQVCLCFFGDGGANQGTFHESLNMAAIWNLPVIYLCENNRYSVTTATAYATAIENIADRASAYGIPGVVVDGQDPEATYGAVAEAVARARRGEGPALVEAKTYRFFEHAELGGLQWPPYRTAEEIESWRQRDPIVLFGRRLAGDGVLSDEAAAAIAAEVKAEIDAAVTFAKDSPFPEPHELYEDMYATTNGVRI